MTRRRPFNSGGLYGGPPAGAPEIGEFAPQEFLPTGIVHLAVTLLCVAALLSSGERNGWADPPADQGFVAVAAVAGADRVAGTWDEGFGGEVGVGHLTRAGEAGTSWVVSVGALAFATRTGGRAWTEVAVARRPLGDVLIGVGLGPAIELDRQRKPRLGAEATLWAYTGIVPYLRVGTVEREGAFAEAGLRIALPAARW